MKTLLFATGETKKLGPLTENIVSPLLPILNRPLMDYSLEVLGKQNIKQIDVSLYARPDEIEAYFDDGKQRGLKLNYHLQREAWGDGGAVRWAYNTPNEPVLLLPADILIDLDVEEFRKFHESHAARITILVAHASKEYANQPRLRIKHERITGPDLHHLRESDPFGYISTGVFLISPEIIQQIPRRTHCDILTDLIPSLLAAGYPVFAFEFCGYWNPLQSFIQYKDAQLSICSSLQKPDTVHDLVDLKYMSGQGRKISQEIWIGRNNTIHPSAQISSMVYMHENNRVEKDVTIGPNVIIGRDVVIDSEATVNNAIILDHTYIGRMLNVESKIIYRNLVIDIKTGEHIQIQDEFLLAETEEAHVNDVIRRLFSAAVALVLFIILLPIFILFGLFLGISGSTMLSYQEYMHTDFRWFIPVSERRMRKFNLFRLQTRRKDGSFALFGNFLERSQLYRYPELINVIFGDIAFIGVKPLASEIVSQLTEEWQKTRFSVPSGLLGLWYLRTDENAPLDQILIVDSYYSATRSLKTDLGILNQAPKAWFKQIQKRN